jgi:hypothetical protein
VRVGGEVPSVDPSLYAADHRTTEAHPVLATAPIES